MFGRYFKIFLPSIVGLVLIISAVVSLNRPVQATQVDECNEVIEYPTKPSDFNDARININYHDSDQQIDVSAHSGYQITEVALEVPDDGFSGFHVYATGAITNFNPPGSQDITGAKVKVKKVCATPTPTPTPSVSPNPSPCDGEDEDEDEQEESGIFSFMNVYAHRSSPSPCPSPSPSPEPSPSPTPPVGGEPGPSVGGNVTTPTCPSDRPQKVDQVWFTDVNPGEVTVHWVNKGDASGFHIAYGPSADDLPWGVEVGNVSEVTLKDLPGGDLWVSIFPKSSKDCGGPTSGPFQVGAVGGQVLGATGTASNSILFSAGASLIALGLWQAQKSLSKRDLSA